MALNSVLWLLFFYVLLVIFEDVKTCKQECSVVRVHGLKSADCFKLDLREFPQCLPSDIEVIELSYNRIRKLRNSDLANYPYTKHLYLMDNFLKKLDEDTFKNMNSLETLDLSNNGILKLPSSALQLSSLKTLKLDHNSDINIIDAIEKVKPISSPLTKLDISYITEKGEYTDFPDLGPLPFLASLSIIGNGFRSLAPIHFAGLCNLQILDNANVTIESYGKCHCRIINNWLTERRVKFTEFICLGIGKDCEDVDVDEKDKTVYQDCLQKFENIQRTSLLKKVGIGVGASAAVVIVIITATYLCIRRNRKRQKKEHVRLRNLNTTTRSEGQEQLLQLN